MAELDIGDWLWFDDMGSYTTSTSTRFNGYGTYVTAYYITESIR
jgi:diaminopimelate decarboxylase